MKRSISSSFNSCSIQSTSKLSPLNKITLLRQSRESKQSSLTSNSKSNFNSKLKDSQTLIQAAQLLKVISIYYNIII